MSNEFTIEIITPENLVLKSDVSEVIIPSYEGEMGILKDHIPLITFLRPGVIVIKGKEEKKYYVEEGTVEFSGNNLLILTSTAKDIKVLDKSSIDNLLKNAEKKLQESTMDKDHYVNTYKINTLREIS
tara:strand:+ start:17 stop:400 length:384 start_codon:yes stop_codon:yes gene_type:complete